MRLFVSYAHVDRAIVKDWVVSKLVSGGHAVWFDDRLVVGQDWKQQLSDEIERSDAFVYCMTPESVASEWCQWELAQAVDYGKPVIPVLLQAQTQLPDQLKELQYVDFSDGPTGDAVARLMGGLQQLSPTQIPPGPTNPRGIPPQAIEPESLSSKNNMMKLLSHPATQAIIGIVGVLIGAVALLQSCSDDFSPELTQVVEFPTPMTPSSMSTSSATPTLPVTMTNIALPSVAASYPCNGRIVSHTSAQLNVVRASPSSGSTLRSPIQPGTNVIIENVTKNNTTYVWYQIAANDGNSLGWIPREYIELGDHCPR